MTMRLDVEESSAGTPLNSMNILSVMVASLVLAAYAGNDVAMIVDAAAIEANKSLRVGACL